MENTVEIATIQNGTAGSAQINYRGVAGYVGIGLAVCFIFCLVQAKLGNLDKDDADIYFLIISIVILWPVFLAVGLVVGVIWGMMTLAQYICDK